MCLLAWLQSIYCPQIIIRPICSDCMYVAYRSHSDRRVVVYGGWMACDLTSPPSSHHPSVLYFSPPCPSQTDVMVLERLLQKKQPAVFAHLQTCGIQLNVVCISWFLCIFINSLPMESTLRVWDLLMVVCGPFALHILVFLLICP